MEYDIISREEAVVKGLPRYFTGEPCIRGHVCQRRTNDSHRCLDCERQLRPKGNRCKDQEKYLKRHYYMMGLYRKKHREKLNEYTKEWRKNNPERDKQLHKIKKEKNPEKYKLLSIKSRHRRRRPDNGHFGVKDVRIILEKQNNLCATCKCKVALVVKDGEQKAHVDHIHPLAKGGSNWPSNLQILCWLCNARKGDKTQKQWERYHKKYLSLHSGETVL